MSAWLVIVADDLNDVLLAPQMSALRTAALATGQADPFTESMEKRANYVRSRIAGRVQLSATAYAVPPELKHQACLLIMEAMQGRIPALRLTDDQKTQIARAYKDLDIAGTTDLPISTADDATTPDVQQSSGGVTVVSKPTSTLRKDDFRGL